MLVTVRSIRKETEKFGRELRGVLVKKGYERVGLAYRELIGSLYESWKIGIERVWEGGFLMKKGY
ncbi:hypothetical protein HMPREF9078_01027 [Capnocytophaga sp. oral taxon 380 str. F0488]|nr:hypothetical protein HMPREF9078_01027 [Capnocytophaga sp. oral taxon 380 str. F0488]